MSPPLAQSVDCAKAARCRRLGSEPVADIAKATILIRNDIARKPVSMFKRFVSTKTPEQRSCLMLHRTRHLFIRQQTSVINAIRAHFAEFGIVAMFMVTRTANQ